MSVVIVEVHSVEMLDSNFLICSFVFPHALLLNPIYVHDFGLPHDAFMYLDQFSSKFLNPHVLSLAGCVLVFYCLIQVSSSISSLHQIGGIIVSLLFAVIFN